MKNAKALAIGFLSILVLFLASGCGKTYELPWDQFCLRIEDNREILLSAEDKGYIIDALNKGNWSGSTTDCECDFVFYTAKQEVRYHSECGTFNDCTNRRAFELSEEQRQRINEMLNVRDVARVKASEYDLKSVEHTGTVPTEFEKIISGNMFCGVTAFSDRILKAEVIKQDKDLHTAEQKITMMDLYGKVLAEYIFTSDDAYHVKALSATDDGGFIFALGFRDYAYSQYTWASDNGFASRVIKCDRSGALQFDTSLDGIEGDALSYCFETDGRYYLFGTHRNPLKWHEYGETDIYAVIIGQNGETIKSKLLRGSDFDSLINAEKSDTGFLLSIRSQSDDGDFYVSDPDNLRVRRWVIELNQDFAITEKKINDGRDYFNSKIGEKNGVPIYVYDITSGGFDAGSPTSYIDYGDFYLIVSQNNTGIYEHTPPQVSAIWYYTETVYSAYDQDGKLIFRSSVDSSPNYDSRIS